LSKKEGFDFYNRSKTQNNPFFSGFGDHLQITLDDITAIVHNSLHMKTSDSLQEIDAMKSIAEAIEKLDEEARLRVLGWAKARFAGNRSTNSLADVPPKIEDQPSGAANLDSLKSYGSLPELYHAADPKSEAEKGLVAAAWFQVVEGMDGLDSQTINSALKDLGYGVGNITRAFDVLISQRPALMLQLRKAGTTKQARKQFKVTDAGLKKLLQMLTLANNP
jgi:hypothetical protein